MRGKRLLQQIRFCLINDPYKRADFLRNKKLFANVGTHVSYQPRMLPLYGSLISIGDNVIIGSNVCFLTHDAFHDVCNRRGIRLNEKVGCIKVGNNCFIGANVSIMYDVKIGDDAVIAAGAVVTHDVPSGEVWGGVPAKHIGYTEALMEKYRLNIPIKVDRETLDMETVNKLWANFNARRAVGEQR